MQNPFAKKSLTEGYQFLKHANRRLPMSTGLQDPQRQLQKLWTFTLWLGIAVLVLLILLIATAIAPYIHFGTTGDTDKLLGKLNEMEKSIQANATGKLTAQHFDKELKSLKCEVRAVKQSVLQAENGKQQPKAKCVCEEKTPTVNSTTP
ncbi:hypothetical protein [Symmachiella macrocystis]|uniref:hypothetical protein n=1 Tax=Symmachiella macrocystis TaxID=2527985 RepID=UPI0011B4AD00|nr:hypothetical protein [Symmachiella macrocystis]